MPHDLAEVSFLNCQETAGAELQDLHDHFAYPLCSGTYYQFIAAIIIHGSYESVSTTFTVWLLDGRHFDSGYLFFTPNDTPRSDFKESEIGRQMYSRALKILEKEIPDSKVQEAKNYVMIDSSTSRQLHPGTGSR
jgi:hypothetical protein